MLGKLFLDCVREIRSLKIGIDVTSMETLGADIARVLKSLERRIDDLSARLQLLESQGTLRLQPPFYSIFNDGTPFDWEFGMPPDVDTEHMDGVAFEAGTVVYVDYDKLDTRNTCTVRYFVEQVHAMTGFRRDSGSYYAGMIHSDGHLCVTFAKV